MFDIARFAIRKTFASFFITFDEFFATIIVFYKSIY